MTLLAWADCPLQDGGRMGKMQARGAGLSDWMANQKFFLLLFAV